MKMKSALLIKFVISEEQVAHFQIKVPQITRRMKVIRQWTQTHLVLSQ